MHRLLRFAAVAAAVLLWSTAGSSQDEPEFQPRTVVERQPAITDAPFLEAAQANVQLNPAELVLGVVVNGQAVAYPINMLNGPTREIINDQVGGVDLAATW